VVDVVCVGFGCFELTVKSAVTFAERPISRGRSVVVPSGLPRLDPARALASVTLPLHVNWSQPGRVFDLGDRAQRARVYEIVLREGVAADVLAHVDGVLLVELWDELVLPCEIRAAWSPLIERSAEVAA
jgi:hypothetical protein